MKKTIKYLANKLYYTYDLTQEHLETLFLINANDSVAEFENRDMEHLEDLDGNAITWKTCDELVELGLLVEDEEAFSIFYELTDDGKEVIRQVTELH
jgi:hypothetical protein